MQARVNVPSPTVATKVTQAALALKAPPPDRKTVYDLGRGAFVIVGCCPALFRFLSSALGDGHHAPTQL